MLTKAHLLFYLALVCLLELDLGKQTVPFQFCNSTYLTTQGDTCPTKWYISLYPTVIPRICLCVLTSSNWLNFAHLFQQSIDTGEIPKEWSLANICPLFKKSDRSLACNYRPVSLTCVPCKLLEHIVCSNIMAHLDEYKLLSDRQYAFRKGHSRETQ